MKCTRCGFEMGTNDVCPGCGMVHNSNPVMATAPSTPVIPAEYTPISAWGYLGWNLLFSIPCVGFIIMFIFAVGGTRNINLRNYARSFFCIMLILLIITIITAIICVACGASLADGIHYSYSYSNH